MAADRNKRGGWPGRVAAVAVVTGLILTLPLVAMQFSEEVKWTGSDFVLAGALLFGVGMLIQLALWSSASPAYKLGACVTVGTAFVIVWASGAVGIVGSENNDANLMFFGVLAVALFGSLIARFRADGMARALFVTALAHAAVGAVAYFGKLGAGDPSWPYDVLVSTGVFTGLWLLAGGLFQAAARGSTSARLA